MPYFQGTQALLHWHSSPGPLAAGQALVNGSWYVSPMDLEGEPFAGNLIANTLGIAVSINQATGSTQAFTSTARIGLFTRSGSTLQLVNSASTTWGYGGATSTSATWTSSFNGARLLTFGTTQWSSLPFFSQGARYYFGMAVYTNGFNGPISAMSGQAAMSSVAMSGAVGVGGASVSSQNQWMPFRGALSVTTAAPPATIPTSNLVASAATGMFTPWVRIDNDFRNYA
jgi:hypothetical protein